MSKKIAKTAPAIAAPLAAAIVATLVPGFTGADVDVMIDEAIAASGMNKRHVTAILKHGQPIMLHMAASVNTRIAADATLTGGLKQWLKNLNRDLRDGIKVGDDAEVTKGEFRFKTGTPITVQAAADTVPRGTASSKPVAVNPESATTEADLRKIAAEKDAAAQDAMRERDAAQESERAAIAKADAATALAASADAVTAAATIQSLTAQLHAALEDVKRLEAVNLSLRSERDALKTQLAAARAPVAQSRGQQPRNKRRAA